MAQTKGWFLSKLVFDEHVSFFSCQGFWMFTPTGKGIFSLMFQHGMGNEGH
jgi:hypothetical protein